MNRNKFFLIISFISILMIPQLTSALENRESLLLDAKNASESKDYEKAKELYQSLLKSNQNDYEARLGLAFVQAWSKDYEKSENNFKKLIKDHPQDYDALIGLSRVYFWQKKYSQALSILENGLSYYPQDQEILALKKQIEKSKSQEDQWTFISLYDFQAISFAEDAHGIQSFLTYEKKQKWSLGLGYRYLDKFNDQAHEAKVEVGFWIGSKSSLSLSATWAPSQEIIPLQSYQFNLQQILIKPLIFSLRYRFSHYRNVDVHGVMPGLTWYFLPQFALEGRYSFDLSDFNSSKEINHSFSVRLLWNPAENVTLSAGYAHTSESFESGNPINPTGSFSSHHFLGGFSWDFYQQLGFILSCDHERRNNDTNVTSLLTGLRYRW
ncbi:MAG: YaiO family outer membrane beta-barrel protein [Deltaproteobacteria bacterium]|nr:YaiO family outer membrane beta-barrel protein [Deltaproteobacteria bacterium]